MKLVDDAHNWHRWWSMRWIMAGAILESLREVWPTLPADWLVALPGWVPQVLGFGVMISTAAAAASRVVKQSDLENRA